MKLIGNENTLKQISVAVQSSVLQNKPIPHILLAGVAGCGKTTIAKYIAGLRDSSFIQVTAESVNGSDSVYQLIKKFNRIGYNNKGKVVDTIYPSVVFIDETHRMSINGQEHIGMLMENSVIVNGNKAVLSPRFTLIGATTIDGMLSKPFIDRFAMKFTLEPYTLDECVEIVKAHSEIHKVKITENAATEIAKRGRGIPRIVVTLLKRCIDTLYSVSQKVVDYTTHQNVIDYTIAMTTFTLMSINDAGLNNKDITLLKTLYKADTSVGLDTLSIILNESPKNISLVIEPYLVQQGFIIRKPSGRTITKEGSDYLKEGGYIEGITDDEWIIPVDEIKDYNV